MVGESLGSSTFLNGENPFLLGRRCIIHLFFFPPIDRQTHGRVEDLPALTIGLGGGQRSRKHMIDVEAPIKSCEEMVKM